MARNKKPALTSPWKIGFLVSLLMVAVSIGVGYFMTRSFGVTWSWIEFHGTWSDFTFHQDAFMAEMLPLAVLVPVFALLASMMITGAVRKYRNYLDSGIDYKRLIQNISRIEDLNDEAAIRKLTSHPELRNFLLNIRKNVVEREKAIDAREAALGEARPEPAPSDNLGAEVDILISAAIAGPDGFRNELALSIPELKRVETAVRENLVNASSGKAEEQLAEMRADLEKTADALRARLAEIHDELTQSEQGARELESELATLRTHAGAASPAPASGDAAAQAISRLDSIAGVLDSLGEETRSVAIKTALQASSADASVEGVVKLADEVRDVAAKFNGVAAEWNEASTGARDAFAGAGNGGASSPHTLESLDAIASRVGRWAEHSVILAEKLKTFEQHFNDAFAPTAAVESAPAAPESEDWGFETTAAAPRVVPAATDSAPGEATADAVAGIDVTGFEKQERLFSEIGRDDSSAGMFADIPPASADAPPAESEPGGMVDSTTVELESPVPAPPETAEAAAALDEYDAPNRPTEYVIDDVADPSEFAEDTDGDGVITGPKFSDDAGQSNEPVVPASMPDIELDAPAAAAEDEAIDLYALGAEDYEPENAHHNV